MKNVEVNILLYELQTNLEAPDPVTETWGPFISPDDELKARFAFDDQKGTVSLVINHNWSINVVVTGTVRDEIIEAPNPYEPSHYQPFLEFYIRAFEVVNHFISRFRLRLFRYDNAPIKWSVREASARGQSGAYFAVHSRSKFSERWFIDGEPFDLLKNLHVQIKHEWGNSYSCIGYDADDLNVVVEDVGKLANGQEVASSYYDTCLELLMQAQEIVRAEHKGRRDERQSALAAAIIITTSAYEVFVKEFVRQHGTALHRFIIKKRSFSVRNFLHKVIADLPVFKKPANAFNAELVHNLNRLVDVRNDAAHAARPVLKFDRQYVEKITEGTAVKRELSKKETTVTVPIEGWMIHSDPIKHLSFTDTEGEAGSFVWDVLALMNWLRVMTGEKWLNDAVRKYWESEAAKPVKTREREVIYRHMM